MCLFAPAPYYKLDKGFFLGFHLLPYVVCVYEEDRLARQSVPKCHGMAH